jgi:hypothetical protein
MLRTSWSDKVLQMSSCHISCWSFCVWQKFWYVYRAFVCKHCKTLNNVTSLVYARTTILNEPQCSTCSTKHRWFELKSLERSLESDLKKGSELERQNKLKEALEHYENVMKKYHEVVTFRGTNESLLLFRLQFFVDSSYFYH